MESRRLGRTGRDVGVVGLGTWQLGGDWGEVRDDEALALLRTAVDEGVTLLDTADVYGDGRSEQLIGRFLADLPEGDRPLVATKAGRRADPHEPGQYTADNLRAWTDRSRANLGVERLDLVQLHCPPTAVFSDDAVFEALDALVDEGLVAAYGVSVETVDEAMTALARPHLASLQIILNAFRRKPLERVLPAAAEAGVGVLARVPLASGLLTGKYDETTTFAETDHRSYNRDGAAFDIGETFSGVPYELGLRAAAEVGEVAATRGVPTAALALRWVLDQPGVTCAIPGARTPEQARSNAAAAELDPLTDDELAALERVYDTHLREVVHHRW
ncbi:aldo/keto reductase [uncultured Pseudokineococcus sp.]|uniref:aldo/keto reductase n=1 Tax=uncultured Pseudokineococcus sp. TaxID=1642928 RepID=UPI0026032656|nr:aldo/keto reductase [uncultured Pseudokineococcus sp.]